MMVLRTQHVQSQLVPVRGCTVLVILVLLLPRLLLVGVVAEKALLFGMDDTHSQLTHLGVRGGGDGAGCAVQHDGVVTGVGREARATDGHRLAAWGRGERGGRGREDGL